MSEAVWEELERAAPLFADAGRPELPEVVANMVVSADGKATVGGHVAFLTNATDQAILYRLRSQADAVLVGSATVLAEGYGDLLPPGHAYSRGGEGRERQPLLAILTRRPWAFAGQPVLADPGSDLVFLTGQDLNLPPGPRRVHRLAPGPHAQSGAAAFLRGLAREHGVRRVVCEGGPTVLGSLLREGLVDQLFVAVSPVMVHEPQARPLVSGGGSATGRLLACIRAGDYVFLRYRMRR